MSMLYVSNDNLCVYDAAVAVYVHYLLASNLFALYLAICSVHLYMWC